MKSSLSWIGQPILRFLAVGGAVLQAKAAVIAPSVTISTPAMISSWTAGSNQVIRWKFSGDVAGISYVNVAVSLNAGTTFTNIATGLSKNTTLVTYSVPISITKGAAQVRVRGMDSNGYILAQNTSAQFPLVASVQPVATSGGGTVDSTTVPAAVGTWSRASPLQAYDLTRPEFTKNTFYLSNPASPLQCTTVALGAMQVDFGPQPFALLNGASAGRHARVWYDVGISSQGTTVNFRKLSPADPLPDHGFAFYGYKEGGVDYGHVIYIVGKSGSTVFFLEGNAALPSGVVYFGTEANLKARKMSASDPGSGFIGSIEVTRKSASTTVVATTNAVSNGTSSVGHSSSTSGSKSVVAKNTDNNVGASTSTTSSSPTVVGNPTAATQGSLGGITSFRSYGRLTGIVSTGFSIEGKTPRKVVVRCLGPGLSALGNPNGISKPRVAIWSAQGAALASGLSGSATSNEVVQAVIRGGGFPASAGDAGVVLMIAPGSYTAEFKNDEQTSGDAWIEIVVVP